MRESRSEKKGTASPMMNEMAQPTKTMANQTSHPLTVCDER